MEKYSSMSETPKGLREEKDITLLPRGSALSAFHKFPRKGRKRNTYSSNAAVNECPDCFYSIFKMLSRYKCTNVDFIKPPIITSAHDG